MVFRSICTTVEQRSKVLTFGKTQINLVIPSLNRTFAPKFVKSYIVNRQIVNIMMTAKEIRESFKKFFESKEHLIVPSAPMVVKDDPTLMFT